MQNVPLPYNENERLEALYFTGLLDSAPDAVFDAIALKAAVLTDCASTLIALVDKDDLWMKSKIGLTVQSVPRHWSFCAYTILAATDDVLVVPDARLDHRFASSPLVTSEPFFRFYAGAPIKSPDGYNIGAIGGMDTKPKNDFSKHQRNQLRSLAQETTEAISKTARARFSPPTNQIDRKLGKRLKQAREDAQLSQTNVADQLNISTAKLQDLEDGALRIDATLLLALARLLNVPMRSFFHGL